jgi:hypothetical protein
VLDWVWSLRRQPNITASIGHAGICSSGWVRHGIFMAQWLFMGPSDSPRLNGSAGGRHQLRFLTQSQPAACARTAMGEDAGSAPPHERSCPTKEEFSTTDARKCTQMSN